MPTINGVEVDDIGEKAAQRYGRIALQRDGIHQARAIGCDDGQVIGTVNGGEGFLRLRAEQVWGHRDDPQAAVRE